MCIISMSRSTRCVVGSSRSQSSSRYVRTHHLEELDSAVWCIYAAKYRIGREGDAYEFRVRIKAQGRIGRYEVVSLEPFFAFIDVFGEILHEGYRPKRLVWDYLAAKGL